MLFVVRVAGHPDPVVRDHHLVLDGHGGLAPLKVEHVVGDVVPVRADVLRVVQFFVNAAGLVNELRAGCPGGS